MLNDFKQFLLRGNVLDLAIGVIIGASFGKIVSSLVEDVIMPPIGLLLGNVDFSNLFWVLQDAPNHVGIYASLAEAKKLGAVTLNLGLFLNTIISFIIVAFAIFCLIRAVEKMKRQEVAIATEPTTKICPYCYSEIAIKATRCPHCTSSLE